MKPPQPVEVVFAGAVIPPDEVRHHAGSTPTGNRTQLEMVRALRRAGWDVTSVYSVRPVASFPRERRLLFGWNRARAGEVTLRYLPFLNFSLTKTVTHGLAFAGAMLLRNWRAPRGRRILLTYNLSAPHGIFLLLAARLCGAKLVPLMADFPTISRARSMVGRAKALGRALERWIVRRADALIPVNPNYITDLPYTGPYLHFDGALPDADFARLGQVVEARQQRHRRTRTRINYFGTIDHIRGALRLLEALCYLDNSLDVKLIFTGRGSGQAEIEAAARRDARIEYLGFVSAEEMQRLYEEADVLVNPHACDGPEARYLFPSKVIEYLASGVPVVSTSASRAAELYDGLATFARSDNPRDIAAAIDEVLHTPEPTLRERSLRARAFIETHKVWSRQGERLSGFLAAVVDGTAMPNTLPPARPSPAHTKTSLA